MAEISGVPTTNIDNVDGFYTTQGGGGTATATPQTASIETIQYASQTLTISNTGSYTDGGLNLAAFCVVKSGSVVVTPNTSMSYDDTNGVLTWTDEGGEGTRTFFLNVQDFGFASSSQITGDYTRGDNARKYWRYQMNGNADHTYTRNIRFYTELSQGGTEYPVDMTSDTAPSPYIASASYIHSSTYAAWKAFDSSTTGTGWWNLGHNGNYDGDFCQVYMGTTARAIKSAHVALNPTYAGLTSISILGANDADFTTDVLILVDSQSKAVSTTLLSVTGGT